MKLDRELQHQMLKQLADVYPRTIGCQQWTSDNADASPNLHYLFEHGLIAGDYSKEMSGGKTFILAKITAAGIDFLADDGGLSAILGVVTVKLHDDTVRQLIAARIQDSDMAPEEKSGLLKSLKDLPGEALKHLTVKLLDAGLDNWPMAEAAIQLILK